MKNASRRGIFAPHLGDRPSLARCPVCRWAIEQDHEEALAMHAGARPQASLPAPVPTHSAEADVEEAPAVVGFALI